MRRDRSRDGWRNTVTFIALTSLKPLWRFAQSVPPLERIVNWLIINNAIRYAPFRPNPLSTAASFSSWASLSDKSFFGRHLPPVPLAAGCPTVDDVGALFKRPGAGRASRKSTALFAYFAQWFTDGFMRSDFRDNAKNRMKNTSNHEIDLCNLYGLTPADTALLRSGEGGRLKSQRRNGEEFPPFLYAPDGGKSPEFAGLPPLFAGSTPQMTDDQRAHVFAMGSDRANITTGYAMMNVLFLREHNRIAGELAAAYPAFDDERLFQTTRNIMIVLLLKIVVEDYVNHIAPYHFKCRLVAGRPIARAWHRPNWVSIEFNLLYRWHSLTPNVVFFGNEKRPVEECVINNRLLIDYGLAKAFAGASQQRAGEIGMFNTPAFLYARTDVPSIATGRTAELAGYNDYREWCGFPRVTSVDQISSDPDVRAGLKRLYKDVDQIELYAGLFAEDLRPNSALGPLVGRMVGVDALSQALTNPLLSEHLYNATTFTARGLRIIDDTQTLNDVVQRNVTAAPSVSFTHREFKRTSSWDAAPAIALEQ